MQTETLDKLFLELSQFTQATTKKELGLIADYKQLREAANYVVDCYADIDVTGLRCAVANLADVLAATEAKP